MAIAHDIALGKFTDATKIELIIMTHYYQNLSIASFGERKEQHSVVLLARQQSMPIPFTLSRLASVVISQLIFSLLCVTSPYALAKDYFNPNALERQNVGEIPIDLSRFRQQGGQQPGVYRVDVVLNGNMFDSRDVTFVVQDGRLQPQLTLEQLQAMGVKINAFPTLAKLPADSIVNDLGKHIPQADSQLQFDQLRLDISVPQAALNAQARGYIDQKSWDQGIPAAQLNYTFNGARIWRDQGQQRADNNFLSLHSGINMGSWRLRNHSTYSGQDGQRHWNTISTFLQRDVQQLRGQILAGQSYTPSDVFDSVQFLGLQLASDDNMLPDSLKGFAPVVRGIAQSNAQVTIRQNNNIIYQTYVAPGVFAITDLFPVANSGDLDVTIQESDGRERHFVQPFSAVPVMVREGQVRYGITAGQYRTGVPNSRQPGFGQSSLLYGLPGNTTLYGGTLFAKDYHSLIAGIGHGFGHLGSLSLDVAHANSQLNDGTNHQGQSYRFQYAKDIATTGTTFTLAGYRYSTAGYYSFQEANELDVRNSERWQNNSNRRSKVQLNISQSFTHYGNAYLAAYMQDFWRQPGYERNISAGYNFNYNSFSYNLSYTYSQAPGHNANDQQLAFSVQVPLGKWLANSWASYSLNSNKNGAISQQLGLSGTAMADNNLSYSLQQAQSNRGKGNAGNISTHYKSSYGELNGGYNYDTSSSQLNYGIQGGVLIHQYGVTLSQPLGDTVVLVRAPGAKYVKIQNNTGVYTDGRGYAVVPYASSYRENRIALDTQSLGHNVDIDITTQSVVPTQGAVVLANFHPRVGERVLLTLLYQGSPVPFGATAELVNIDEESSDTSLNGSIVGDDGQLYLSGVGSKAQVRVKWGNGAAQQCRVIFSLTDTKPEPITAIHQRSETCK
ncbi:fimbria/pilus outer membrane usher protein [Serratia fonticola]|uniref:fimbria/pilus outer membrane usher protein n=1 Tax=Serratia fonticola TaxID=47917 RepID=UPI0024DE6B33|nr:fimbria/pilus outer membrane usher protein [Serratia fonticola]MDK2375744.1 fimbria/pilus outer membrane usher protein [Serratia fonticola]